MARRKLDTSNINTVRLAFIQRGYLTQADVKALVPCGKNKAAEIYQKIRKEVRTEGLENCRDVILAKRMLKFLGLTTEGVISAAKLESKR